MKDERKLHDQMRYSFYLQLILLMFFISDSFVLKKLRGYNNIFPNLVAIVMQNIFLYFFNAFMNMYIYKCNV